MAGPISIEGIRAGATQGVRELPRETPEIGGGSPEVDFADQLLDALGRAGGAEKDAKQLADRLVAGDTDVGIHEVMVAAEKASIQLRYAVTLKNRVIEAYRELMRTPV